VPRTKVAIGVDAAYANQFDDDVEAALRTAAHEGKAHAIGSCGLSDAGSNAQKDAFLRQVAIAQEFELPLIVQSNGAHAETLAILNGTDFPLGRVLVHAFNGTDDELQLWAQAGCYVSFNGARANDAEALLKQATLVSPDRVLVESGAPADALDELSGYPARCDQSVFAAAAILPHVSAEQLAANAAAFFNL